MLHGARKGEILRLTMFALRIRILAGCESVSISFGSFVDRNGLTAIFVRHVYRSIRGQGWDGATKPGTSDKPGRSGCKHLAWLAEAYRREGRWLSRAGDAASMSSALSIDYTPVGVNHKVT